MSATYFPIILFPATEHPPSLYPVSNIIFALRKFALINFCYYICASNFLTVSHDRSFTNLLAKAGPILSIRDDNCNSCWIWSWFINTRIVNTLPMTYYFYQKCSSPQTYPMLVFSLPRPDSAVPTMAISDLPIIYPPHFGHSHLSDRNQSWNRLPWGFGFYSEWF